MHDLSYFDAGEHGEMKGFEPMPPGNYLATILSSGWHENSEHTGSYLKLAFEIRGGPFDGRQLWRFLNLEHVNDSTVDFAQRELATIYRALGLTKVQASEELHGLPLFVRVKKAPRKDTGEMSNTIFGYVACPADTVVPARAEGRPF